VHFWKGDHRKQLENSVASWPTAWIILYPHPWLMKDFWEFQPSRWAWPDPAIYQARFNRYLENRD